ncbi:hypothetical protein [Pelagibacterium luteolum]|uniref:Uncharacterized protein n=1 Tax=Pelagibacterium luteolum TaxID=440168 RepID=A0A1G7TIY9_9HYPH|nr:hypothetical protein [Pelagibacterium luteolum]SDG34500.1 hypothetical protein SAMN04487974_102121 [Pelagibacterium luteolum]
MGGGGKKSSSGSSGGYSWAGGSGGSFNPESFNKQMGADIQRAYQAGPAATYNQPLYTGMSATTQAGLSGLESAATRNAGMFDQGIGYTRGLLSDGGLAGGQQGNIDTVNNVAGQFGSMATGAMSPSLTEEQLMAVARGQQFGTDAPGYSAMRGQLTDDVLSGVGSQFTSSGRFGGGSHINQATDRLTSSLGALDYTNYQNDIARQERALAAIEGQRQQGFTNRFNALGAQAGAAGSAFGMDQQGVANAMGATAALPGLYQASLMPSQTILGVGQARDADAQARRLADYELFQRTNDPAFQHIAKYQGLLGQQSANPQPEKGPGLFDWLGLGIAGAGALL